MLLVRELGGGVADHQEGSPVPALPQHARPFGDDGMRMAGQFASCHHDPIAPGAGPTSRPAGSDVARTAARHRRRYCPLIGAAIRLHALAETITTPAVKARVLEQAQEHARGVRLTEKGGAS